MSHSETDTQALVDPERLAEIEELDLASGDEDPVLDEMAARAAEELNLPIGLVSIVLDGAQIFAGSKGVGGWLKEAGGSPVEWSFCQYAVMDQKPLVIEESIDHPQVGDSPLIPEENLRSYAGVPLRTSRNQVVGTLCVIGHEPRKFGPEEISRLSRLAEDVVHHLERRRRTAGRSETGP